MERRRFLTRGAVLGASLVAGPAAPGRAQSAPDDPSKALGGPKRSYGARSRFETSARRTRGKTDEHGGNLTPLGDLYGIITPSELHFTVFRGGVPEIDPARHRLLIHGMVERPVLLTMND